MGCKSVSEEENMSDSIKWVLNTISGGDRYMDLMSLEHTAKAREFHQIGRASCRERV